MSNVTVLQRNLQLPPVWYIRF